jgi:hypothetical protein
LYLELGDLVMRHRPDGTPRNNPEGQFTVYAGFDWRVEGALSVLGSRSSSARQRTCLTERFLGSTVSSATIVGRLPELQLGFSNGMWLVTFNLPKGQPDWSVAFLSGPVAHLFVNRGRLAVERRDS